MSNSKNTDLVELIANAIWRMFDIFRGSIPTADSQVILFLLSAYKDRLLKNTRHSEYSGDINSDVLDSISKDSRYRKLLDIYAPIIKTVTSDKLEYVLDYLQNINPSDLQENFGEIFDNILYRLSDSQGKHSGEFIQPLEISRFIMNLANLRVNGTVYNPFAGAASFGTFLKNTHRYFAQEINEKTWALGTLRLMAYQVGCEKNYVHADSMNNWPFNKTFDLIVANPPFGYRNSSQLSPTLTEYYTSNFEIKQVGRSMRTTTAENFLINNSLKNLSEDGQLICILPLSFLFAAGREKTYRTNLIVSGLIDTIVELPGGLFKHTSIPACIVVFKKSPENSSVRFVDATKLVTSDSHKNKRLDDKHLSHIMSEKTENEFVRYASPDEIRENDYNITVKRYFLKNFSGTAFSEFATPIAGTTSYKNKQGKFIRIRDLKNDLINSSLEIDTIDETDLPRQGIQKIKESCLLLATRWKTIKATYFKYEGEPIYISNDILALRVDESIAAVPYIISELYTEAVKEQLRSYRTGTVVPMLRKDDIMRVKIELPSLEEQQGLYYASTNQFLKTSLEESLNVVYENKITVQDENSFLKHQIAGSLKNVRGAFKLVKKILEEKVKPEFPNLDTLKVDEHRDSTFLTYMSIIERDLNSIHNSVNKVGDKIELMDLRKENFDLLLFLKDYFETLKIRANNFYQVNLNLDEDAIKEFAISAIHIEGDKELLRKMFDNIIENAEKHAFKYGIVNDNKIAIELLYDFQDFEVQIDFCNTGTPLPSTMSHESMTRKGSSSGKNSGDGVGSWFANEVMKIHNGKFGYTDETGPEGIESEYVTTIELIFPIIPAI